VASEDQIRKFIEEYRISERLHQNFDYGEEFENLVAKIEFNEDINQSLTLIKGSTLTELIKLTHELNKGIAC